MKTVKNGDPAGDMILKLMVSLNQHDVSVEYGILGEAYLISKIHPVGLNLPAGWCFSGSSFHEKNGEYDGFIPCFKPNGLLWQGATV